MEGDTNGSVEQIADPLDSQGISPGQGHSGGHVKKFKPLSMLPLIALIFYDVSGGPFGIEVSRLTILFFFPSKTSSVDYSSRSLQYQSHICSGLLTFCKHFGQIL